MTAAVGLTLLSPDTYGRYGLPAAGGPFGLSSPGIVSVPPGFITLVVVCLYARGELRPGWLTSSPVSRRSSLR